jgi:hypothetical protein
MYGLGTTGLTFRGPSPEAELRSGNYFTSMGAAQTFGCFCEQPFPAQLQTALSLTALNLGYGGAGPYFYLKYPALIDYINQGKFAVVQVMSGRSVSNSRFDSGGLERLTRRADEAKLGADKAYEAILEMNYTWEKIPVAQRYIRKLIRILGAAQLKPLIAETREQWITQYRQLLQQITVPKILFWFSQRSPDYQERYDSINTVFGEFPQLVNRKMVEALYDYCDDYVESVTCRGMPQPLFDKNTGEPTTANPALDRPDLGGDLWSHNFYYPSPEMHLDATQALLEQSAVLQAFASKSAGKL